MQESGHDEQNHIENVSGVAAVQHLQQFIEEARTCIFFCIESDEKLMQARLMAPIKSNNR